MKKLLTIILAAACVLSLAASSTEASSNAASSKDEAASTKSTSAETTVLTTITDGVLTMGTNAAFPPYEYYEGETVVGIDAEVVGAIAEALGLELEIVDMDFSSIITSVQTGKIDIGAAGMTVTKERLKNVNFTDSYSTGVQVIIVPEDSKIKSVDDLEGALIGCQEGTTGFFYCSDDYGEENVVAYTNGATAVQALNDGKVDCVVIDQQPAINFVDANEGLVILETEYVVEDYAIAVSKDNEALLEAINAVLKDMKESGKVQDILDKYIK